MFAGNSLALKIFAENKRFNDNIFVTVGNALNIFRKIRAFEQAFFGMNLGSLHQLRKQGNIGIIINLETHLAQNGINFIADVVALAAKFVF